MSLWSKIRSVKIINWMMKNKQKQPTGGVEPIQLTVTNQELSSNCESEPHASTSTSVFTLQDEVNQYAQQNQNSSFADESFGDIGRFLHHVRNNDTISPLSAVSGGTENVEAIPNPNKNTEAILDVCENTSNASLTNDTTEYQFDVGSKEGPLHFTPYQPVISPLADVDVDTEAATSVPGTSASGFTGNLQQKNVHAHENACSVYVISRLSSAFSKSKAKNSATSTPDNESNVPIHQEEDDIQPNIHQATENLQLTDNNETIEPAISLMADVYDDTEANTPIPGTSTSPFTGNLQENVHAQPNACSVYVISRLSSTFAKPKAKPSATSTSDSAPNEAIQQVEDEIQPNIPEAPENVEINDNFEAEFVQEVLTNGGIVNENTSLTKKPSSYIRTHLEIMYVFGTSTFSGKHQEGQVSTSSLLCHRFVSWLQMILFLSTVTLSTLQSFCDAKYIFISFLSGGGLNQLVKAAFCLICLVSSAYGAYVFYYKKNDISNMVNAMTGYEQTLVTKKCSSFAIILALITIFMAFLKPILVVDFNEFSPEAVMLTSSYIISEDLYVWTSTNITTLTSQLENDYGTNLSSTTVGMGGLLLIRSFSYNLQQGLFWDIFANITLAMYSWMLVFMAFVNSVKENLPENRDEEEKILQRKRIIVWKMYREIRNVFEAVNEVYGLLLMLFHVTNVLRYAFLMERIIFPDGEPAFTYVHLLYDIVKSEVIYLVATSISQQNKTIRKWLRNWALESGKIDLGTRKLDLTAVLDELDEEPLGLGQGDFVIDKNFHFGLLGLVCSLFVMLANKTGVKPCLAVVYIPKIGTI